MPKPVFYYAYLRSVRWKTIRNDLMRRVGWTCERCNTRKAILVHHLNYDNLGHEQPQDLMALCYKCHEELHRWPTMAANDNEPALPMLLPKAARKMKP